LSKEDKNNFFLFDPKKIFSDLSEALLLSQLLIGPPKQKASELNKGLEKSLGWSLMSEDGKGFFERHFLYPSLKVLCSKLISKDNRGISKTISEILIKTSPGRLRIHKGAQDQEYFLNFENDKGLNLVLDELKILESKLEKTLKLIQSAVEEMERAGFKS